MESSIFGGGEPEKVSGLSGMKTDLYSTCQKDPIDTMASSNEALLLLIKALTKRVEELEKKLGDTPKKEPSTNINISMTSVAPKSRAGICFRCGRPGHFVGDCYATYHANGHEIDD